MNGYYEDFDEETEERLEHYGQKEFSCEGCAYCNTDKPDPIFWGAHRTRTYGFLQRGPSSSRFPTPMSPYSFTPQQAKDLRTLYSDPSS